jgi:phosphatidylglycerophosphatase A
MISKQQVVMFLATGGNVGRIPIVPGTFGSLVGIPFAYLFSFMSLPAALSANVLLMLLAVWAAQGAERELGAKDPGAIVIDEISGFCFTMLAIPFTLMTCCAGFILFRILDIIKPPPARQIDRRLKGGWGVVMDDVVAGIMGNILLRLALHFFL